MSSLSFRHQAFYEVEILVVPLSSSTTCKRAVFSISLNASGVTRNGMESASVPVGFNMPCTFTSLHRRSQEYISNVLEQTFFFIILAYVASYDDVLGQ